jgi:thiamine-monophosphate kinase
MREFEIIEKFFKPLSNHNKAAQNLSDDVAKISLKANEELVISKDAFVENVHFLLKDGAFNIASKLLRTNLSDLAASGAKPLYYMLGFSKNKNIDEKFIKEFARGLKEVQNEFNLCLIGGDTVLADPLFFSITIFGSVKKGQNLARNNAKNGDLIFVSGAIGDAHLGLQGFKSNKNYLINRHLCPTPRIELGQRLVAEKLSNCAIDVSDGLIADLQHICQASKLDAEIFFDKIPFSKEAKKVLKTNPKKNPLDLLNSGDDYELIFVVSPKNEKKVLTTAKKLKLDLTHIGQFKKSTEKKFTVSLFDQKNHKLTIKKLGYEH